MFVTIFFKTMSDETIIRLNFCDIRNNQDLGKCYHLRPIILHPTKSLKHVFNLSVPCHSFLHHSSQVRLVRSGMGSCIFWGGVDRCIDRYLYRLSIDISVAMSVEGRPIIGRVPVEYRSRACRASTDMLATLGR